MCNTAEEIIEGGCVDERHPLGEGLIGAVLKKTTEISN